MSIISRLTWDSRDYESGLYRGVFYPKNAPGESWNGLIRVLESGSGSNEKVRYVDGIKILTTRSRGDFSGTIEAFTYPDSFYENTLMRHRQNGIGLSYRVGNKIHLVYNVLIAPPSHTDQQLETDPFRWGFTTLPLPLADGRSSAHLIVDAGVAYEWTIAALEDIIYGSESASPRLPLPDEVLAIFDENSILKVTNHGDGTFTIEGPDEAVFMLDATSFQISWPSVVSIDSDTYEVSSL